MLDEMCGGDVRCDETCWDVMRCLMKCVEMR